MKKPYFIMMYNPDGISATPLTDENDNIAFFETELEAEQVADDHSWASVLGYKIVSMND
jgi:hypothetical protein